MESTGTGKDERSAGPASRPLTNTYWIQAGRFLAGEHPGAPRAADAISRLRRLLDAGIDYFIDLTEEHELREYESLLAELRPDVHYRRFPIEDHGLPEEPAVVTAVLDCIDEAMAAGHNIYLHCRAGVGRTGTVLGCHFVRHGVQNEQALDRLSELWQQSERSRRIPQIPETDAQASYVRFWHEAVAAGPIAAGPDRVRGALLGLAAGEAASAGNGSGWGRQAAMTLVIAESLMARAGIDPDDQMRRYQQWRKEGHPPGATQRIEVPAPVSRAVATWQWTRKAFAGPHDPANLDPHTLARTTAVALYFRDQPDQALDAAMEASRTTHQAPVVLDCCRYFAALLLEGLSGTPKQAITSLPQTGALLKARALKPDIESLLATDWQIAPMPATARTAPTVLAAALVALVQSRDFASGLEIAMQVTGDTGAVAAVYGALAGTCHGVRGLPAGRVENLKDADLFESVSGRLTAGPGAR